MRYYLAHDGGIENDADYDNSFIVDRYKKALSGGLGNLASRITRGKKWNVRMAIQEFSGTTDLEAVPGAREHLALLKQLPGIVDNHFEALNSGAALRAIQDVIYRTNAYVQEAAPWSYPASEDAYRHPRPLLGTIYLAAESLRICGILLLPFMPGKMAMLLDQLGVSQNTRTFEYARCSADDSYGEPLIPLGKGVDGVLFPPLISDD